MKNTHGTVGRKTAIPLCAVENTSASEPAIKLAQQVQCFCAIAAAQREDHRKSQGYLPHHNLMQAQNIGNLAPSLTETQQPKTPKTQIWQFVPIHWLAPYEPVDTQFSGYQVKFDSAIALNPSNPWFQAHNLPVAIMARGQGKSLNVSIGKDIHKVELWLMSSDATEVSAFDEQGNCVATAATDQPSLSAPMPYSAQKVTIDVRAASTLFINSRAPFLLTRLAIKVA